MRLVSPARFARALPPATLLAGLALVSTFGPTVAQGIDCERLRQQIAQAGQDSGGDRYAAAARKQEAQLARSQAMSQQLGCEGFTSFFGANPQCGPLKQRIQALQASIGQMRAAGGSGLRNDLVARFNAYCRAQPARPRGFFESLFGGDEPQPVAPIPDAPTDQTAEDTGVHGGGQALCVRTCDGGFFPMGLSARHSADQLNQACQALCPGAEVAVFTRSPSADIKTAVGLDGKPYVDMPNALKFQKAFSPECTCRPAGKSWAEALANAEQVLGNEQKGDIIVTPEKSEELSRPKIDPKQRSLLLRTPDEKAASADPATPKVQAAGADTLTPHVRQVGPQP